MRLLAGGGQVVERRPLLRRVCIVWWTIGWPLTREEQLEAQKVEPQGALRFMTLVVDVIHTRLKLPRILVVGYYISIPTRYTLLSTTHYAFMCKAEPISFQKNTFEFHYASASGRRCPAEQSGICSSI